MFMTKMKAVAAGLVILGAATYGLAIAAQKLPAARRARSDVAKSGSTSKSKAEPPARLISQYVVEPPDLVVVEVLDALPGRPISGERLVRPDGRISLSFYGDVYVAGQTLPEVKATIINHLRKFISDDALGIVKLDENGDRELDPKTGEAVYLNPKESDMVFVDVAAYNSKAYYIEGAFSAPGRLPVTGQERVLDAICFAGGLTPEADHGNVFLHRQRPNGQPVETLKVDIDQIMLGDDLSTNYQLRAGDRLVARSRANHAGEEGPPKTESAKRAPAASAGRHDTDAQWFDRFEPAAEPADYTTNPPTKPNTEIPIEHLEKRMNEIERKLDVIIESLKRPVR
jgi:polysaccharide export outer membrane protein